MGPNPKREVHIPPQGFSEEVMVKNRIPRSNFNSRGNVSSHYISETGKLREFFGVLELFCSGGYRNLHIIRCYTKKRNFTVLNHKREFYSIHINQNLKITITL